MSAAYTICREARRTANLTQRELAERTGVSPSSIARIERGRMEPTFEMLQRLVEGCDQELLIQVRPIDWTRRASWGDLDFEARLRAIHSASEFAAAAQLVDASSA
ncbi:MAG: helix-turn-helix transcriptional regulator [Acidimicrobiia bacterium]